MAKVYRCECGVTIRGKDDDDLVEQSLRHAKEVHNLEVTREQILAMARIE